MVKDGTLLAYGLIPLMISLIALLLGFTNLFFKFIGVIGAIIVIVTETMFLLEKRR